MTDYDDWGGFGVLHSRDQNTFVFNAIIGYYQMFLHGVWRENIEDVFPRPGILGHFGLLKSINATSVSLSTNFSSNTNDNSK
jgi:hypothetical protein